MAGSILPMLWMIMRRVRSGGWSDHDVSVREQRTGMYPAALAIVTATILLLLLIDPPRPEAFDAIAKCDSAGIHAVMITGDHPETAEAVARELNILKKGRVVTGRELESVFGRHGITKIEAVGQPLDPNRHISSAGIGARFGVTQYAEFQVEGVRRFNQQPNGAAGEDCRPTRSISSASRRM